MSSQEAKRERAAAATCEKRESHGIRLPIIISVALALVTLAVYSPVYHNDFVNYDDSDYITANAHVQGGPTLENITWAFKTGHASNWHPVTWISHMIDYEVFGNRAGWHHLISLGFHIVDTILLFLLLRAMTGSIWRSAFVAALFALHPLHVESVAWASERKDVLSTFFLFLTLWTYAIYCDAKGVEGKTGKPALWYLASLALFALGLMSKPMLVTVPFLLVLVDWWPLQRFGISTIAPTKTAAKRTAIPLLLLEKLPFLLLSIASCVVTFVVQRKGGAVSTSISIGARLANALVAYVRYIGDLFWPRHLSVLYPHPGTWPMWEVVASGVCLLLVTSSVVVLARRKAYVAVGWFWYLGMLVPVIGLIQVGVQSMADRYTYVPTIGLFIVFTWGAAEWVRKLSSQFATPASAKRSNSALNPPIRRTNGNKGGRQAVIAEVPHTEVADKLNIFVMIITAGCAVMVLLFCSLLTMRQIGYWRNSETLFRRAVEVTKNNYLAYNNLGYYLSNQGKVDEAMENYRRSLEINPAYEDAHNNMGYALAGKKMYPEAISEYNAALRIRPDHVEVHNNLGNALADIGKIDEAIEQYSFVLKKNPEHADAHNNLGVALAMKGRFDEAIEHFRIAIRIKPKYASAHSNLGNAFAVQHKLDDAIQEYEESLRLNPKDSQAHNNLANALTEQGKGAEAVAHYTEALEINKDNPEAHYNLGLAMLRQGKREEARGHFTEALRLKPDYSEAQTQLNSLK